MGSELYHWRYLAADLHHQDGRCVIHCGWQDKSVRHPYGSAKNLVKGMASLLAGSGVVEVSGTDKNETGNWSEESDGVYTTTRTAKIAGDRHYASAETIDME